MVDGKYLVEYINERNEREFMGCLGTSKKPMIDVDEYITNLICSLTNVYGNPNLRWKTYKDYCADVRGKPMSLADFQLLEKITEEVPKGIFRRSKTII